MNPMSRAYREQLVIVPPPPPRFSLSEWYLNNRLRYRNCLDQQQLADKVLAECQRGQQVIDEVTANNKTMVDNKIKEKIADIEFNKAEILKQRKQVVLEVDNLVIYNERIMDQMAYINSNAYPICKKCLIFRESRVGIDLCHDDVERELHKEIDVIEGVLSLLKRTLEQASEQLRRLRSTLYLMDRDMEDKDNVLIIDRNNLCLNENSLNLSMYHGHTPLDAANISAEEWDAFTRGNIETAAKEITSARCFRCYVDTILKQVADDLIGQMHTVNDAFRRRIEETKEAKTKAEVQHSEITRQANEMVLTITALEKTLAGKEGFMALSHTRMGNRAQRNGMELCRDLVETTLVNEVLELRQNCAGLQQLMSEAKASMRYLLKTQIQLEEDINVRTNTLKIDEVDCMTLRQSMDYHEY